MMFRKILCAAIASSALLASPCADSAYAGGGRKGLTFEFKVQVSPRKRAASKKWKTVVSYKRKAAADRKAATVRRNHPQLDVRVKQRK